MQGICKLTGVVLLSRPVCYINTPETGDRPDTAQIYIPQSDHISDGDLNVSRSGNSSYFTLGLIHIRNILPHFNYLLQSYTVVVCVGMEMTTIGTPIGRKSCHAFNGICSVLREPSRRNRLLPWFYLNTEYERVLVVVCRVCSDRPAKVPRGSATRAHAKPE